MRGAVPVKSPKNRQLKPLSTTDLAQVRFQSYSSISLQVWRTLVLVLQTVLSKSIKLFDMEFDFWSTNSNDVLYR